MRIGSWIVGWGLLLAAWPSWALDVSATMAEACEPRAPGATAELEHHLDASTGENERKALAERLLDRAVREAGARSAFSVVSLHRLCLQRLQQAAPDELPDERRTRIAALLQDFHSEHASVCSPAQWQGWERLLDEQPQAYEVLAFLPTPPADLDSCLVALQEQTRQLESMVSMMAEEFEVMRLWERDGEPGAERRGMGVGLHGRYIARVIEGLPAERAGLRGRDLIIAIDGVPVWSEMGILHALHVAPADTVQVRVRRWDPDSGALAELTREVGLVDLGTL